MKNEDVKIEIRPITEENEEALALPNDPFLLEGRVTPIFDGKAWSYEITEFPEEEIREDCFPDENYSLANMEKGFHGLAIYVDGVCAGYALLFEHWNKWLYLDNLLISARYRRLGLGSRLMDAALELAASLGKYGVWLICQDNNLQAMRFYLNNGFTLGGMNLRVYEGTGQEGKADLYLYRDV